MNKEYKKIWELAKPYLKKGKMKDFLIHTKGVVKAMELLLKKEKGDGSLLMPAAILHDVGWAKVPLKLQKSREVEEEIQALKLHLEYAPATIKKILLKVKYNKGKTEKIIKIVLAHKFKKPKNIEKRLLIDADSLSDVFKEQFYSDIREYNTTPEKLYNFRKNNKFFTETAKKIFDEELEERRKELK